MCGLGVYGLGFTAWVLRVGSLRASGFSALGFRARV